MVIVETISEIREMVARARAAGKTIGFVPTMGALHQGHASLIDAARGECGCVIVSIFVNPAQFGPSEDFSRYPRTLDADRALCEAHGADAIFAPSVPEIYPQPPMTTVRAPELSGALCGASRPGHFDGVCLVVSKLFNIVLPDRAYFGGKDFQQLAIIQRMTRDLDFPVEIVPCETVREADGLAMSSRNRYLSADERRQAPALHQALSLGAEAIRRAQASGQALPPGEVLAAMRAHLERSAPLGEVDYLAAVDPRSLSDVAVVEAPVLLALAVRFGGARLIDNVLVE